MSIVKITRICGNKELNPSCIHGCDKHYCTNTEPIIIDCLDSFCSGYINSELFKELLKGVEEEQCRR